MTYTIATWDHDAQRWCAYNVSASLREIIRDRDALFVEGWSDVSVLICREDYLGDYEFVR